MNEYAVLITAQRAVISTSSGLAVCRAVTAIVTYREITEIQRLTDNEQVMYARGTAWRPASMLPWLRCDAVCYLLYMRRLLFQASLLLLQLAVSNLIISCACDAIALPLQCCLQNASVYAFLPRDALHPSTLYT